MSASAAEPDSPLPCKPDDFTFQVNLAGVIQLLSHHLYSGPHVYLRELLQNATDAIQARAALGPGPVGEIHVELVNGNDGAATLLFEDNGIGLTEGEVHRFLSTIGLSSKSGDLARRREDFIGQFGIGLLSCFMVTDEIVMITQSAREGHGPLEWRGTGDGRYSLKPLAPGSVRPGTKVYLRARSNTGEFFTAPFIREHLRQYGGFLPIRVELSAENQRVLINEPPPPWKEAFQSPEEWREACLDFGEKAFGLRFLDCLPLRVDAAGIEGVGFILPSSPSLASRRADRVYLKNMFLTEKADNLLPEWAFFARCLINATRLNPSASRESIQQDVQMEIARTGLEKNLRDYLLKLARHDHDRLRAIVKLHFRAIKMLAVDDDEFYRLFIDWLPFETSQGDQSLKSIRESSEEILYAPSVDTFRQMSQVAAAQSVCVVNAGYVCDVELLEKLPEVFPHLTVRRLQPNELLDTLEDLTAGEQQKLEGKLDTIESVLRRFHCDLEVKRFRPADLPALYSLGDAARSQRDLERSKERSNDLWAGVLDGIHKPPPAQTRSQLCLNFQNPLVRKLITVSNQEILRRAVELLYVHALLQGHYPLDGRERAALNDGLTGLIELAVNNHS